MSNASVTLFGITPEMSDETKQMFIDELGRIADQIRSGEITEISLDIERGLREKPTDSQWVEYENAPGMQVTVTVAR